jgi:hypothetical protein
MVRRRQGDLEDRDQSRFLPLVGMTMTVGRRRAASIVPLEDWLLASYHCAFAPQEALCLIGVIS